MDKMNGIDIYIYVQFSLLNFILAENGYRLNS